MNFLQPRKPTRGISVGGVKIGNGADVAVQSMTNTPTRHVDSTVEQISRLASAGCEIIRVAVPDPESAAAVRQIKDRSQIPVIADIHFDHRLAVKAAESGADGLRINPGNIGDSSKVGKVVACAKHHGISIRVGVNSGSLEKDIVRSLGNGPDALAESALRNIGMLENLDFRDIKVSVKASDVARTVLAYRRISNETDIPLHLGITEAGGLYAGIAKSSVGIGMLLAEGIGDTIRVSLTRDPAEEVRTAWEILRAVGLRKRGVEIISCPTCGRCGIDLFDIAEKAEKALLCYKTPVKVAIMGCVVNGPGEAKEADLGIAGGRGTGVLFKKGEVIRKIPEKDLLEVLLKEVEQFVNESGGE
ncbi:MAG: flavodoxin-dependent (E)-4-hydroxy-3-methylbut-2-enyl-diphosphate synthase [Desulfobacteraceae bacterium]